MLDFTITKLQITNLKFFRHGGASNHKGLFFKPPYNPTWLTKIKQERKRLNMDKHGFFML